MKSYKLVLFSTLMAITFASFACPIDDEDQDESTEFCLDATSCCASGNHILYHPEYPDDDTE